MSRITKVDRDERMKLAKLAREETDGGEKLVQTWMAMVAGTWRDYRGRGATSKDVLEATRMLREAGWGLPVRDSSVEGADNVQISINFSAPLTEGQLAEIPLLQNVGFRRLLPVGEVIDVTPEEEDAVN